MFNRMKSVAILLLAFMCAAVSYAEIYTLDRAKELFNEGLYEEAAPTFEKELKKKSKDGKLNYYYGVCLYHMGAYEDAVKYLEKAADNKVDKGYYYLGEAYKAMWYYADAVEAYENYFEALEEDEKEPLEDELSHLTTAKVGERMMRGVECVQVIDSISVDSATFFHAFKLSAEAGRILDCTHLPKTIAHDNINSAYLPQRGDMIYMSMLQDDSYDLYQSHILIDKSWSEPQSLSETLNDDNNQAYPFMLSDGLTLYYAQDGAGSLGGYDIFVTMYSSEREDFMLPQNVGMPFNSPYNDYMMAIDETMGVGWFVTDRNQIPGMLTMYIFIVNETKQVYREIDYKDLVSLARLDSISATWEEGADYAQLLDSIANIKVEENYEMDREFTFVLCNGMIYTRTADFKSEEALQFYNQALAAQRNLSAMRDELAHLRVQYSLSNAQSRTSISERILQLEEELLKDAESPEVYENRAREAELIHLGIVSY